MAHIPNHVVVVIKPCVSKVGCEVRGVCSTEECKLMVERMAVKDEVNVATFRRLNTNTLSSCV